VPTYVGSRGDEHPVALDDDQTVAGERPDDGWVEVLDALGSVEDEAENRRPPLAERAGEWRLPARGLVACAARRARLGQGTCFATRDPRQADGCAEIHQRLSRAAREPPACAALDTLDVHVAGQHVVAEGEVPESRSGVGPDPRELGQIGGPAVGCDPTSRALERDRATVVPEPLPLADDVGGGGRGERSGRRPSFEPALVSRYDAVHLGLLQHHFADKDRVRVPRASPREVAAGCVVPGEEQLLHEGQRRRAVGGAAIGACRPPGRMTVRHETARDPRRSRQGRM